MGWNSLDYQETTEQIQAKCNFLLLASWREPILLSNSASYEEFIWIPPSHSFPLEMGSLKTHPFALLRVPSNSWFKNKLICAKWRSKNRRRKRRSFLKIFSSLLFSPFPPEGAAQREFFSKNPLKRHSRYPKVPNLRRIVQVNIPISQENPSKTRKHKIQPILHKLTQWNSTPLSATRENW